MRYRLKADGVKDPNTDPRRSGIHTRGYLPHIKREGASYFVTFRLADSLPKEVLARLEAEREAQLRQLSQQQISRSACLEEVNREFFRKVERYLDRGLGECFLKRHEIAETVATALGFFHGSRYLLDEWTVMPNHVHVVVWPMPNHLLSGILKSWKGFTAREANRLLNRTGQPFWQRESYDHWIRDEEEKARIRSYVRRNPATAHLCERAEDWRWGSAWSGYDDMR